MGPTPAALQANHRRPGRPEDPPQPAPPKLPPQHHALPSVYSMHLKHLLRRVQANSDNLFHGRLLEWVSCKHTLAHRCRRGPSTPTRRRKKQLSQNLTTEAVTW